MNLNEFENQYRHALDANLNRLQTAVLLMAQLEVIIAEAGKDLQNLTLNFEEYVNEQRSK